MTGGTEQQAATEVLQLPVEAVPEPGPVPAGSRVPFEPNPRFVGRQADLQQVARALIESHAVVLTGADGLGKTELAAEFVHRYGRFFPGGVFWLSFRVRGVVPAQVAACGGAMELRGDFADLTLDEKLQLVVAAWHGQATRLLVYDDCDDEGLLREWLPARGGARVLVTSRRPAWGGMLPAAVVPLAPLSRGDSVVLLRGSRADLDRHVPALSGIADELGDLPLALRLAAGVLQADEQLSPETCREQLRSPALAERAVELVQPTVPEDQEARGMLGGLLGRRRAPQDLAVVFGQHVARAFLLSLSSLQLADRSGAGTTMLRCAARFAHGEPVPREALLAALEAPEEAGQAEPDSHAETVAALVTLGLIEADREGRLRLHPLLAKLVLAVWPDGGDQLAVEDAVIAWARRVAETGDVEERLWLAPHVEAVARSALERAQDLRAAALCAELGTMLWGIGDVHGARPQLERALAIREQALGPDHPDTIASLSSLGALLQAQGDLGGAQAHLERAREQAERTLGPDHPDTLAVVERLGWVLHYRGEHAGARAHLERVLEVSDGSLGPDHPDTAARLHALGTLLQSEGDLAAAQSYLERALAVWERTAGPDDPRTLASLSHVGLLLKAQGELGEAQDCLSRALEMAERTLGPDHPGTAAALDNLGTVMQAKGELGAARTFLERGLAIRHRTLGPEHPGTAISLSNMGLLLRAQGDLEGALPYLEQARLISQRVLGPYDSQTATSLNNLGRLLQDLGDLVAAQPYLERAVAIREQVLGSDHPETAAALHDLGLLAIQQGDVVGARPYLERALEVREQAFGAEHPRTADTLHALGGLLRACGDARGALTYLERAVAVRERELGPDHPDTLASIVLMDALRAEVSGRK